MKPLLQTSRRDGNAGRVLRYLVIFAFGLTIASAVQAATTYSYSGSHSLTWTSNTDKPIWIERTGGYDSLVVYASLTGNSKFTLSTSSVAWGDTTTDTEWQYDTARTFYVDFNSSLHDTCYAKLVIHDGHHSDTISLVGYGTDDGIDFTFRWMNGSWDTATGQPFARIMYNPDSGTTASLAGLIYNHRSSPIEVSLSLSDSTHWDIDGNGGSEILDLNGTSDHTYGRTLQISYTPHGVYLDSVEVTVSCSSPDVQTTTFWIFLTDPRYAPTYYAPTVSVPTIIAAFDTTVCQTVTIRDTTSEPISITAISAEAAGWSSSGIPSLPVTLNHGDSINFSLCFEPQIYRGQYYYDDIEVSYTDTSGLKGSTKGQATAVIYEDCVQALRSPFDTLKLDEVIEGGYVETSESFIMHLDTELTAGKGVMYQGGSIQVVSPNLPKNVHAGDTVTVTVRVIPPSMDSTVNGDGLYYGYMPLGLGGCGAMISFEGTVTDSTNTDLQLLQNETGLLALTTQNTITTDTFWFDNNYSGQVLVSDVELSNQTNFEILGELPHSPVDTLAVGNKMGVIIQFDGDTNGFYHDSLIVTTENSRTEGKHEITSVPTSTHIFNLEAIRTQGVASVGEPVAPSPVALSIVPNPADGPVTISITGTPKAEIEIYDLLGNRIGGATASSFEWNAGAMPNGTYLIRASGVDANGTSFVTTKRLSLQR